MKASSLLLLTIAFTELLPDPEASMLNNIHLESDYVHEFAIATEPASSSAEPLWPWHNAEEPGCYDLCELEGGSIIDVSEDFMAGEALVEDEFDGFDENFTNVTQGAVIDYGCLDLRDQDGEVTNDNRVAPFPFPFTITIRTPEAHLRGLGDSEESTADAISSLPHRVVENGPLYFCEESASDHTTVHLNGTKTIEFNVCRLPDYHWQVEVSSRNFLDYDLCETQVEPKGRVYDTITFTARNWVARERPAFVLRCLLHGEVETTHVVDVQMYHN
ncbi:MAG: hypothetical protein KVP17_001311 [Porospora cf. gigantea B]|uniref:uncharacterized protein n=1 Tax=Porospora cf. gigantea B TaxID=2853592 RepID=UPI003571864E|nr:MAG: hypothetical protein KVP17_001311 [Porospora cf. gigantea B]